MGSDLRPAFNVLDVDHDGKISRDDLRKFYSGFSSGGADEEAIKTMMSVANLNKDGFVEYDEFERVLGSQKRSSSRNGGVMEDNFNLSAQPPLNIAENRAAFPKTFKLKNPWRYLRYVIRDVFVVFALAAAAAYFNSWSFWPLYWAAQGTMFWAIFVLGHDW